MDSGPSDLKRICTTFQTPNCNIQTQNGGCSGSILDEISATDCNLMNFSTSVCKTRFGVLGLIIGILLLLLVLCGVAWCISYGNRLYQALQYTHCQTPIDII